MSTHRNRAQKRRAHERYEQNKTGILQRQKEAYAAWKASLSPREFFLLNQKYVLMYRYKLTPESYKAMFEAQGSCCKLCRRAVKRYVVDHDHACCPGRQSCGRCVRGILCVPCNAGLGFIEKMGFEVIERYLGGRGKSIGVDLLPAARAGPGVDATELASDISDAHASP